MAIAGSASLRDETLRIIEILWSGAHTVADVHEMTGASDRGLLAIYGSHPVFGDDALLFIDGTGSTSGADAAPETFAERLNRIGPWIALLPSEATIYVGRLGGTRPVGEAPWAQAISDATRLTTFFHAPPWNGRHVDHHRVQQPTVVLNLGRRHRLAMEVSTLWDQSAWTPETEQWMPFSTPSDGEDT